MWRASWLAVLKIDGVVVLCFHYVHVSKLF